MNTNSYLEKVQISFWIRHCIDIGVLLLKVWILKFAKLDYHGDLLEHAGVRMQAVVVYSGQSHR